MAFQDRPIARTHASNEPNTKIALDDLECRWIEMIRAGGTSGPAPLVLLQVGQQLLESPLPRRRSLGILAYPLILLGAFAISAFVIPPMLAKQVAKVGKAKGVKAGDGKLVLNATCITGEQRLAIINGRTYRLKDTLDKSNAAAPSWVIAEILPHKVLLECQGKRLQLCYADRVAEAQGTSSPAKSFPTETLPPELSPGTEGEDLNRLLEKVQQGDVGLGDLLPLLSNLSSKKE